MNNTPPSIPEIRASETDPPQIAMPPVTPSALPIAPGESGTGRRGRMEIIRSRFGGGIKWKKTKLWFVAKKETVVEDIK